VGSRSQSGNGFVEIEEQTRVTRKPGEERQIRGLLPSDFTSASARSAVARLVASLRTNLHERHALTGLKKMRPKRAAGFRHVPPDSLDGKPTYWRRAVLRAARRGRSSVNSSCLAARFQRCSITDRNSRSRPNRCVAVMRAKAGIGVGGRLPTAFHCVVETARE